MACCQPPASIESDKTSTEEADEGGEECDRFECPSDISTHKSTMSGFVKSPSRMQLFETSIPPNISHELNVAKSILQRGSSNTGDNIFDHLAEIIKRAVNEPQENIVDFFEEYSYNLREQKFRIKEPFKWSVVEPPDLKAAINVLSLIKLSFSDPDAKYDVCRPEGAAGADRPEVDYCNRCIVDRPLLFNENVLRLHLYWSLCGFNISTDEAIQLAMAMQKLQALPILKHVRFWGKIYAIKQPYYIVEARLTPEETKERLETMKHEMMEKIHLYGDSDTGVEQNGEVEEDPDLVPGYTWRDQPEELLKKMIPEALPVPKPKPEVKFNVPPEPVGAGVNKLTYFVVNSLVDDWIELPIVTPKQVEVSRKIKRLLTGDLEAEVVSFPEFPGNEKHLLRAMIARITAGTYIAPRNYYRTMTKCERKEAVGEECSDIGLGEEECIEEEKEEEQDNDALIIEDSSYKPAPSELTSTSGWVHFRPNILDQGRVRWFNVEKARRQLEKEEKLRTAALAKECGDDDTTDELDEMEEGSEEEEYEPEVGPLLFSNCLADKNTEKVRSWSPKLSSNLNEVSQLVMMRSNLWPGAFAYSIENYSDCIYLGWGTKYNARNMPVPHLPPVPDEYEPDDYIEMTDPTPEMELAYEIWLKNKDRLLDFFPEGECEEEDVD